MKKFFHYIGRFLKGIWNIVTFLRMAVFNLLFLVLLAAFAIGYFLDNQEPSMPMTPKPQALVLNINGPIVEQTQEVDAFSAVSESLSGQEQPKETKLYDLVQTIRTAANDESITGLVLKLGEMPETSLTKLKYIAKAIQEFKQAGKPVYAQGDFYNQSQYYLASNADQIFLAPDGGVLLKGYQAYGLYYKDLLDNLDLSTHIFRVGTYKSAVEPFIRNDMSPAAREATLAWINQMWDSYVDDIAKNRNIDAQRLKPSEDELLGLLSKHHGDLAQVALELKLVDKLASRQEVNQELIKAFGQTEKGELQAIGYQAYQARTAPSLQNQGNIAVIVARGTILDGEQPIGRVGGDSTSALLKRARLNPQVKAVILRVDSPGGSAFASEVIRNEIQAIKAAGKPVVVSMSSLAASGGYWISMDADKIIASPNTITGSIGIFGVITTAENILNDIGVHTDGVGTSPFSKDGFTTGLSDGAKQAMQLGIEHGYQRFIGSVANARGMSPEEVDKIAQGRVWTGRDAKQRGLVDELGDFDTAIVEAAKLAKLDNYQLNWVTKELTPTQELVKEVFGSMDAYFNTQTKAKVMALLPSAIKPMAMQLDAQANLLESLNDPKGQYAFCLVCQIDN